MKFWERSWRYGRYEKKEIRRKWKRETEKERINKRKRLRYRERYIFLFLLSSSLISSCQAYFSRLYGWINCFSRANGIFSPYGTHSAEFITSQSILSKTFCEGTNAIFFSPPNVPYRWNAKYIISQYFIFLLRRLHQFSHYFFYSV